MEVTHGINLKYCIRQVSTGCKAKARKGLVCSPCHSKLKALAPTAPYTRPSRTTKRLSTGVVMHVDNTASLQGAIDFFEALDNDT